MERTTILVATALAFGVGAVATASAANKTIYYIQCGSRIAEGLEGHIATFEKANPDYKIEVEVIGWGQCQDKVTTLAAAGNPASMAYVGSRTLKQFAVNDLIVPIPMTAEERASYWPTVSSTVEYNGQAWGIPIAFSTKALFYNKELFRKAGLDPESPPKTWDELYSAASMIKEKTDSAGYGLAGKVFDSTMHQFLNWVYTNGGSVIEGDEITFNSPNNVEALEWYGKMATVSQSGATAHKRSNLHDLFNDSKIAMYVSGPWARKFINDTIDWGVTALPVGPKGAPGTLLITDSVAVFKGTGVEDKAIEFAKFFSNPENQFAFEKIRGLTPLRPVDGVKELVAEDPTWKPFLDAIPYGGPEPLFEDYKGFQEVMLDAIQAVLLGESDAAEAVEVTAEALEDFK